MESALLGVLGFVLLCFCVFFFFFGMEWNVTDHSVIKIGGSVLEWKSIGIRSF